MTRTGFFALATVTVLISARGAEAQRKLKYAFDQELLEITQARLDQHINAMRAEAAGWKELATILAAISTEEQYNACQQRPDVQEETQKIMMVLANVPDNISQADFQKLSLKMQSDMEAMVKKKCGNNPSLIPHIKAEKEQEIELRVQRVWSGNAKLTETGELEVTQYRLIKERAVAFCMSKLAAPGTDFSADRVEFPGEGKGVMWFYTSAEARALQARCKEIVEIGKQVT